jgi:hypothetical protein
MAAPVVGSRLYSWKNSDIPDAVGSVVWAVGMGCATEAGVGPVYGWNVPLARRFIMPPPTLLYFVGCSKYAARSASEKPPPLSFERR